MERAADDFQRLHRREQRSLPDARRGPHRTVSRKVSDRGRLVNYAAASTDGGKTWHLNNDIGDAGDHEGALEPATSGIFGAPRGNLARPFRGYSAKSNFYQLSGRLRRCEWKEPYFYFFGLSSLPFFSSLFFSALGGLSALSEIT